jgi:hypothetical protein
MSPDAGKAAMGGPAEYQGTKGYAPDDAPLRDGHIEEPDLPDPAASGQSSVATNRPGPAGTDAD